MIQFLPLAALAQNTGQIDGLPSNPRQWTQTDIDRLAKSLEETPELFEARPLIVYPYKDKYVILGGNLRFSAAKKLKMQDVPVHILDEDLSREKLREIVIKDNGSFGEWDMDMLANEWDDIPFADWGLPDWMNISEGDLESIEDLTIENVSEKERNKSGLSSITFLFPVEQVSIVTDWIAQYSKEELAVKIIDLCRNVEAK